MAVESNIEAFLAPLGACIGVGIFSRLDVMLGCSVVAMGVFEPIPLMPKELQCRSFVTIGIECVQKLLCFELQRTDHTWVAKQLSGETPQSPFSGRGRVRIRREGSGVSQVVAKEGVWSKGGGFVKGGHQVVVDKDVVEPIAPTRAREHLSEGVFRSPGVDYAKRCQPLEAFDFSSVVAGMERGCVKRDVEWK
ncbi:hypothetical protein DYB32_008649, partial [Aphanomyces invadans]